MTDDQQYSPPPATPYAPAGGVPPTATPVLSIISLVAGIIAVLLALFFGFVPLVGAVVSFLVSAAAVVLGHLGQRRERQARGFWLTGLILGYIGAAISVLWFIGWIALFAFASAQATAP